MAPLRCRLAPLRLPPLFALWLLASAASAGDGGPASVPSAGAAPAGLGDFVESRSGLVFVRLPGGLLAGGTHAGREVKPFSLGKTEVTLAAYTRCVAAGACTEPGQETHCTWKTDLQDHPINCLEWEQARAFCAWARPAADQRGVGVGRERRRGAHLPLGQRRADDAILLEGEPRARGRAQRHLQGRRAPGGQLQARPPGPRGERVGVDRHGLRHRQGDPRRRLQLRRLSVPARGLSKLVPGDLPLQLPRRPLRPLRRRRDGRQHGGATGTPAPGRPHPARSQVDGPSFSLGDRPLVR